MQGQLAGMVECAVQRIMHVAAVCDVAVSHQGTLQAYPSAELTHDFYTERKGDLRNLTCVQSS